MVTVTVPKIFSGGLAPSAQLAVFHASGQAYYLSTDPSRGDRPRVLRADDDAKRRESEVGGSSACGLGAFVHALRAVQGADVAEAAFRSARHSGGRLVGRQSADQCSQVLYELVVHGFRRYADRVIGVGGLPPEFESPVTLQRSRDGVQVNHHLDDVTGALLPGLHVDDDRLAVPLRDQVGLAGQRC